jgi:hypothetical protein
VEWGGGNSSGFRTLPAKTECGAGKQESTGQKN